MEKASERVPPNPKPLTWHQLRDLEYAGRRPDPFRTSESYDEHGKLLNPVGGEPDTLRTTEIPPQKKEMEKASERVPPCPKPLTWLQMRDLEYAGRRPDPFRTSESYDEHGKLLNPVGGESDYLEIVNRLKFASPEPPMPPPPITPTPHTFETEYGLQKLASEKCLYCTKLGHGTAYCSYRYHVPKNAPVGPGCDLVCRLCESPFSGTCCGLDEGRAILKECLTCASYGDHWPRQCPRNKGLFDLDLPRGVFAWISHAAVVLLEMLNRMNLQSQLQLRAMLSKTMTLRMIMTVTMKMKKPLPVARLDLRKDPGPLHQLKLQFLL